MFRYNLAPRLMLAMLFIVTLVAASLFAVTRRSLETAWQEVLEARFVSQMESLASLQKARLDSIGERCRELAASPVVINALESGGGTLPEEMHRELMERARVVRDSFSSFAAQDQRRAPSQPGDGTRSSRSRGDRSENADAGPPWMQKGADRSRRSGNPGNSSPLPAPGSPPQGFPGKESRRGGPEWVRPDFLDLALMDASGRIHSLKPPNEPDAQTEWLERNQLSRVPSTQEVAYLAVRPPEGSRFRMTLLREIIITPILKPGADEPLGALVVGLPVSTYGETALYDLNRRGKPGELYTGLWIDNQLFSRSIPREATDAVTALVRTNLGASPPAEKDPVIHIDGKPWQLLYRSLNPESSAPQAWRISLYSLEGLAAQRQLLRTRTLTYATLAFAAAAALSWFIARRLVQPVHLLVDGTRQIAAGNYETRVPITTHDELSTLGRAFNEMAAGLKQRQQYRDILFQVSDDDIARQLIETACLGGERREITVLFCDIRDFTGTTSGMPPENVIELLNEHMTALTEIVHRHHGVVDKFVGDLIMAIFGAPKSYGDDAGNAAACALGMMERRRALNQTTAHPPLLMGIGIASGTAIAGCMGSEHRLNYTVLGEPVNLASRLCSAAGPGEVMLDSTTAELLGPRAVGQFRSPLSLKGFPGPVAPFHLSGLKDYVSSQQPDEKPSPPSIAVEPSRQAGAAV